MTFDNDKFDLEETKKKLLADQAKYQQEQQQEEQENDQIEIISPSEALRKKDGTWSVEGKIIGRYKEFDMVSGHSFNCMNCGEPNKEELKYPEFDLRSKQKCKVCRKYLPNEIKKPDWKTTVIVELQDTNSFNDLNRLSVFLFEDDTEGIRVGESVIITGDILIQKNNTTKYFTYLYGKAIKYLNRKDFTLTKLDIEANKRFVLKKGQNNVIDELVKMHSPEIIGNEYAKKALLLSDVNTSEITSKKEKIHELFIGDPGQGKSELLKWNTNLVPGSNYTNAQNAASGKSLLGIIDKVNDGLVTRYGPIPLARDAIAVLNELGWKDNADQSKLLDVIQDERFNLAGYGHIQDVNAPVTVHASCNPIGSTWKDDEKIDLNEFPILPTLRDRFDLVLVFRRMKDPNKIKEFGEKRRKMLDKKERGQLPDYTPFLLKYIQYARQLKPKISEEASIMLSNFDIDIKIKGYGTERVLPALRKISKAFARLKLKEIVDEQDATDAMQFYDFMLWNFQKSVVISQTPIDVAYQECVTVLKSNKNFGYTLEELFTTVSKNNKQIASYFGYDKGKSLKIADNKPTHKVYDKLSNNHSNIKIVQQNPIVLKWFESDQPDPSDRPSNANNKNVSDSEPEELVYPGVQFGNDGPINISSTPKNTGHIGHIGQIGEEEEEAGPDNY